MLDDDDFTTQTVYGVTTLTVRRAERMREAMTYAKAHGIRRFDVWRARSLDFVDEYREQIDALRFGDPPGGEPLSLDPLYRHTSLLGLSLNRKSNPPDLRRFPELKSFVGIWHTKLGLEGCSALRSLNLTGYTKKTLEEFPWPSGLEELSLSHGSLASSVGIGGAPPTLVRVELAYIKQLTSLSFPLESNVRHLQVDVCGKAILDRGPAGLVVLALNQCAALESLAFLADLRALETFRFVRTNVLSGDLQPILSHPTLKWVGMTDRRHFSHTEAQLDEILRKRGGYAIWRIEDMGTEVRPFTRF